MMADTFTIIVAALLAGGLTLALMPMIVLEIRYRIDRHEIGKIIKRFKDYDGILCCTENGILLFLWYVVGSRHHSFGQAGQTRKAEARI